MRLSLVAAALAAGLSSPARATPTTLTFSGTIIEAFYPAYIPVLRSSIQSKDWAMANRMIGELDKYQQKYGGEILPSKGKVKAELLLNKLNIFSRLSMVYSLLSLVFLGLLLTIVMTPLP